MKIRAQCAHTARNFNLKVISVVIVVFQEENSLRQLAVQKSYEYGIFLVRVRHKVVKTFT